METVDNFWGFALNRLDVLKTSETPLVWQWTGNPDHKPGGRIATWLDMFIAGDYRPTADQIVHYAPDIGTELERFDMAANIAFSHAFTRVFGIAVEGVLFTYTLNDTITIKETN